jgi:hypothetical protein
MANKKEQTILVGDLTMIHQSGMPTALAVVQSIEPDGKRNDFWHVKFVRHVDHGIMGEWTWILDEYHLSGGEFTMGGISYFITVVKHNVNGASSEKEKQQVSEPLTPPKGNILF